MSEAVMPVLIGCGQLTDKRPPEEAGTPIELMAEVDAIRSEVVKVL